MKNGGYDRLTPFDSSSSASSGGVGKGVLRDIFIPRPLGRDDAQGLEDIYPTRLRLTAALAMTLFIISNFPDLLLPPALFWRLFWVKAAAVALFVVHILVLKPGRSFSHYMWLTYAQVITAAAGTGVIVYLTGGLESEWALTPGLVILVSGLLLALPLRVILIISLISLSGCLIPALLVSGPGGGLYTASTTFFYYTAFIAVGVISAYTQFLFTMKQNQSLVRIRHMSEALRERDEDLKKKNRELMAQTERAMEANRLKSEFLANISHELRTPLTSVMGFSGILAGSLEESGREKTMVKQIMESSAQLLAIVDDLIDLSMIEAGRIRLSPAPTSFPDVVRELADSMQSASGERRIALDIDEAMLPVMADRPRLVQALYKIAQNAVKFTGKGGQITIGCRDGGEFAEVFVEDDGRGLSEAEKDVIFDRFRQLDGSTTRKHGGLGVGLCIAKSIVELHGGSIQVQSRLGEGSRFTVALRKDAAFSPAPVSSGAGES